MTGFISAISAAKFGPFELDLRNGDLKRDGRRKRLQGQPAHLLAILVRRRGELVTREELRAQLWPQDTFVDFDHGLNNAVNRIREVLGDSAATPLFIETVPRRGYRFIAEVEITGEAPKPSAPGLLTTRGRPARILRILKSPLLWTSIAALVLAAILVSLRLLSRTPRIHSVAVLPFANLSGDPRQEYFSDGMTEELIGDLAQLGSLRVISRTSVTPYKNVRKPLPVIARELNVDAIVEGSLERSGSRVRIRAQLIYAPTDTHLWARNYERDASDILALESEVAQTISGEIGLKLTPHQIARLTASARPVSQEAHDAYLQGLYELSKRNDQQFQAGIADFQHAVDLDPGYALAYAGLANAYELRGSLLHMLVPPVEVMPKAEAAARKAVELDDSLAEAHAALAWVELAYNWHWDISRHEFQLALERNPNYAQAHQWYAFYLAATGSSQQALAEIEQARSLDPASRAVNANVGLMLFLCGRYDDAISEIAKLIAADPGYATLHWNLGAAYEQKRMFAPAQAAYREALKLAPENSGILGALGYDLAVSGNRREALRVLAQLKQLSARVFVSPYAIAQVHVGLGDPDAAFQSLDQAYRTRDKNLILIKVDPVFSGIRSDPRFARLLRRMNLQ